MKKLIILSYLSLIFNLYGDSILSTTIKNLKMTELKNTYSKEKINKTLENYKGLKLEENNVLAEKAVLVDLNIISIDQLNSIENLDFILKNYTSDYLDLSENSLGDISDKNIIERLNKKYSTFKIVDDSLLLNKLNSILSKGLITGYNIKEKNTYANFKEDLSLSYGHNDLIHANQLIGLMKSEDINAKIQIEPKTSAFLHRKDWGTPSIPNKVLDNGQIVITPLEYDLKFEFYTEEDKIKFINLVDKFAKKDTKDEIGLLYKSWWQPFMQTTKVNNFEKVIVNIITFNNYEAFVLTLPKNSEIFINEFKNDSSFKILTKEIYVNPSFYRFMNGGYK